VERGRGVENFIQEEFFQNILPPMVPPTSSRSATRSKKSANLPEINDLPEFRVIRSSRRKRSMQAFRSNGLIEIHIPARMSRKEEALVIPQMIELVQRREAKQRRSDGELAIWADQMLTARLPEITVQPAAINWRPMRDRWGSCTTVDRTIRISHRLALAPEYVIRYVLFHELIHLAIPGHGDDFNALLERFEQRHLAEAFLEGYEAGAQGAPEEIFLAGPEDLDR